MFETRDRYTTLICALLSLDGAFGDGRDPSQAPPPTRLRLDRRLSALTPEDAAAVARVEAALDWSRDALAGDDAALVARTRVLVGGIESGPLRAAVEGQLEIRTGVAALRWRARGRDAPPDGGLWGFGRWTGHMARHWTDPGFGLGRVHPWIREAGELMATADARGLERLVSRVSFRALQRLAAPHRFDLEAVGFYLLKWRLVDRWARHDAEAAGRRFDALVAAGLGHHAALDFEGTA